MRTNALIIFAKVPDKDNVKTRLAGHMGDDERLRLYISLLNGTIEKLGDIPGVDTYICHSPPDGDSYFGKYGLPMFSQPDGDLGDKMYHSFEYIFNKGYERMVIVGVDIPDISGDIIENAFDLLSRKDIVFGPALDGGYYLVGMKRPERVVFKNIAWSTNRTLQQSIAAAESHGYSIAFTEILSDVDSIEDVRKAGISPVS